MEPSLESKPRVSFEFEVEKVIGVSSDGNYQVQWAPAWVSKFHLIGCEHLIQEFLQQEAGNEIKSDPANQVNIVTTVIEHSHCDRHEETSQKVPEGRNLLHEITGVETNLPTATQHCFPSGIIDGLAVEVKGESLGLDVDTHTALHNEPDSNLFGITGLDDTTNNNPGLFDDGYEELLPEAGLNNASIDVMVGSQFSDTHQQPVKKISDRTKKLGKNYTCDVCDKKCARPAELKRHQRLHSGEKPFPCPHCEKRFSQKNHMRTHITCVHMKEKPYICYQCNRSFGRVDALNQHVRLHTGVKPYACVGCGLTFTRSADRIKHTRTCPCIQ